MDLSACGQLLDNFLVTSMNAIKDADRQPGIFQVNFFKRTGMLHIYKCSQRHPWRWSVSVVAFDLSNLSAILVDGRKMTYSEVKNTFFGCQAGLPSSP